MSVWEVFRQERAGQALEHAGSFEAPNKSFAEIYARDFYGRRNESEAVWVVPRDSILAIEDFEPGLDTSYRRVDGYSLKVKLKEARERAAARR
jgi:phenylacetate-CoA oxygenase PaaH subunit